MTKYNSLKQLLLIFTGVIFLLIIHSFNCIQIIKADDNVDYEHALATAPKGLNWNNDAFVIADFQTAAETRLRRPVIVPSNNMFNSSMTNNAQITQSTNPDPNTKGTSVIKMTNGKYQTGAVWSHMSSDNYFDIQHPQKASMWLYFGPSTSSTGFVGDGMAFVLQNDKNKENSIALSADGIPVNGQALGVWGADWDHENQNFPDRLAKTAIQKSWALEFDTFVNRYKPSTGGTGEGVSFDLNVGNASNGDRHIAGNYPALATTYKSDGDYPGFFTMDHGKNYKLHSNLVDGKWHHVTITWIPQSDTDHSQGTLTYAYNDKDPVTGTPITDSKKIVQTSFNIDTNNFGLEGNNTKLYWGFTGSTGKYSENNLLVFESIPSFVDAEAIPAIYDDSQGGSEITESNNTVDPNSDIRYTYTLNYKGWTKNWDKIHTKVDVPDHIKFTSGTITYPNSSDSKPHQIDPSVFSNSNATKLDFLLPDKLTPESRTAIIELHGKTEKNATETLTVPAAHASFEGDNLITDANTIPFKIRYRKLNLSSDSPNIIKVKENEDVYIPAQVTYAGSNNNPYYQNLTVYQKLNNNSTEAQSITADLSGNFELPIASYSLDKINTVSFYVKDQDGNTSNTITRQITVGGNLAFDYVQNIVSFKPINGSFTDEVLPRLGKWQINVVDSREKGSEWSVQAKANDLISNDNNKLKLLGNIFYRDANGKDHDIDKDFPVATHVKDTDGTQVKNIADTWTDNSGILLAVKKGNKAGVYTSKISWSLIDSISNKT